MHDRVTPSPSGGGLGWGWCVQRTPYLDHYVINIPQDLVIPESQDAKSFGLEVPGPLGIEGNRFCMLASVKLYGQATFHADKIHNVTANGVLSAKPVTLGLAHSQMAPQILFCVSEIASQST